MEDVKEDSHMTPYDLIDGPRDATRVSTSTGFRTPSRTFLGLGRLLLGLFRVTRASDRCSCESSRIPSKGYSHVP
jgi:hypothetical protein